MDMKNADRAEHIGWIDFAALSDVGDYGMSQASGLSQAYRCNDGDRDLYGILQIGDAETGEDANMVIAIELFARPY